MRVLIATDGAGGHAPGRVAAAVGRGWLAGAPGTELAVLGLADGGEGWLRAVADGWASEVVVAADGDDLLLTTRSRRRVALSPVPAGPTEPFWQRPSSRRWGTALATALAERPDEVVLDLTSSTAHDAGEGLLAALGGPTAAREALAGVRLVGVVAETELTQPLLGLRGITARRGQAGPRSDDPARMLATDAALERFAREVDPVSADAAGAGAAGGCGFAVLALGGELVSGPAWLAGQVDLATTLGRADLLVTATTGFDFASRGGPVVQQVARWAQEALRPCVVLAGSVQVGAREMRLMGVEAAHPVGPVPLPGEPSELAPEAFEQLATRVARSWARL